ncbi:hypothetical protein OAU50_07610 [Planctomycetota bacterium]|nr:hypothetical protein [Planctomycetota bacterium]
MHEQLQESFSGVMRFVARGEYSAARRELERIQQTQTETLAGLSANARSGLAEQSRVIEILESIDVLRKLLRKGSASDASRAASTILDALSANEYAELGIIGSALTLIGRARELALRTQTDVTRSTREEVSAFVDYMGTELNQLERDCLNPSLEDILQGGQGGNASATLGDLLSRRPWRASSESAVQAVIEPNVSSSRRQSASVDASQVSPAEDSSSPVIGRILIEQEERERAVASQPATGSSGRGTEDIFEIVSRAAIQHWTIVMSFGLIFSAIGYLFMVVSPTEYQAATTLHKSETSEIRAPVTGEPDIYMSQLPPKAVLQQANSTSFHIRVARQLKEVGYAPVSYTGDDVKARTFDLSPPEIAGSLVAALSSVERGSYTIEFTATHEDPTVAEALASGAAEAFIEFHREQLTRQTGDNKREYEKLMAAVVKRLDEIKTQKLSEFQISETQAIGVTLEDRIEELLKELKSVSEKKEQAEIDIEVSLKQIEFLQQIADRIPMYDMESYSERAKALETLLTDLRKEYYSLTRKRSDFGPDHPVQNKIRELNEDIQLIERELEEIRTGDAADLDRRNINPARAQADENVAMAKAAHHDATLRLQMADKKIPPLETELASMRKAYQNSLELRVEEEELKSRKQNYSLKLEEMSAVEAGADLDLALLSPDVRATPIKANTLIGIAVGLILGLVAGIIVAIILLRRRQIEGPSYA